MPGIHRSGCGPNLVAVWREAAVFTEAERAALELTKQGTCIADAGRWGHRRGLGECG